MKVKSLSPVRLLATPWTAAYQAPLFVGFSRQEYWSELPLPSPKIGIICTFNEIQTLNSWIFLSNMYTSCRVTFLRSHSKDPIGPGLFQSIPKFSDLEFQPITILSDLDYKD